MNGWVINLCKDFTTTLLLNTMRFLVFIETWDSGHLSFYYSQTFTEIR